MDIITLKQNALKTIDGNRKPFVLAALAYIGLALIFMIPYYLIFFLLDSKQAAFTERFHAPMFVVFYLLYLAFIIVVPPMVAMAYIKTTRELAIKDPSSGTLTFSSFINNFKNSACGIGNFWWTYLWTVLWCLLWVVPFAIISSICMAHTQQSGEDLKLYIFIILIVLYFFMLGVMINRLIAYSMNWYVLADAPKIGAIEAMKKSKLLTKGHRWELFILDLSFIGWFLLCFITCGIVYIWLAPYYCMTYYNAYKHLIDEYNKSHKEPISFVPWYEVNKNQEDPYSANNIQQAPEAETPEKPEETPEQ